VDLSGIYPALTTPFDSNGNFSAADLKHNLHRYNQTDLAGYVVLGSTGESVLLSSKESENILATAKKLPHWINASSPERARNLPRKPSRVQSAPPTSATMPRS